MNNRPVLEINSDFAITLSKHKIAFESVKFDFASWLKRHNFLIGHHVLEWEGFEGKQASSFYKKPAEIIEFLEDEIDNIKENTSIIICWSNAVRRCVKVEFQHIKQFINEVESSDFEFWFIFEGENPWCLEVLSSGEMHIGWPKTTDTP
jgi:mRNA-degrading endonuclease HigB of HigAB toxin-antitoxin module